MYNLISSLLCKQGRINVDISKLCEVIHRIKDEFSGKEETTNNLNIVINEIKNAFIKDWEDYYLKFIPKFLDKVNCGIPTPVLSVCGRGTQEIRYTKYLGYMLDARKSHGLQDTFLKQVFKDTTELNGLKENWFSNCEVETELWLGNYQENGETVNCFCDIGVIGEQFVILIEQKILSNESINERTDLGQLNRYSLCLEKNPDFNKKVITKLYLTPNGELPPGANDWTSFSHSELVLKGIEMLSSNDISPIARENLKRFLLDLVIGPYQITEDTINEMIEIAKEINGNFVYSKALRFSQLLNENRLLLNVLMEGDF